MVKILCSHPPTRSAVPPGKHLLVFDGDCGFCVRSVEFIGKRSRITLNLIPFDEVNRHELLTSLDQAQFVMSAHYITPEGKEYHGGESITRALRLVPGGFAAGLLDLPGVELVRELGYTFVAGNRSFFSRLSGMFLRR